MSERERISWVGLIVNILIAFWYFQRILALPPDADLFGPRTARFAISLIVAAVMVTVVCEILLRIVQRTTGGGGDAAIQDERDALIDLKATRNAHGVLGLALAVTLVQVGLTEWLQRQGRAAPEPDNVLELLMTGPLAGMHVVQFLLAAIALAAFAQNASRVFYYRRGY
jgi:hypothetical protein